MNRRIWFPFSETTASDALFLLATVYRTLYAIGGSYVTARLAPHSPMKHHEVIAVEL